MFDRMYVAQHARKDANFSRCACRKSPAKTAQEFDRRTGLRDSETGKLDGRQLCVRSQFKHVDTQKLLDTAGRLCRYELRINV